MSTTKATVTFGACQLPDIQGNMSHSLDYISQALTHADREGIDMLCFPEGFLHGYTRDFSVAKTRAIDLASADFAYVLRHTASYEAAFILGMIEIDNGKFYNTAVVIKKGTLIGRYRKTHPNERIFHAGSDYPIFTLEGFSFGINICHDANYPDAAQQVAQAGAQAISYPLNNHLPAKVAEKWRKKHLENLVNRAKDTKCWIISSDVFAKEEASLAYGCTAVVNPAGHVISQVAELTEGVISCSISL